uniref:Lethal giant larvae homologue 2 domain-containing protein n=1 Tax=Ditylenchus dipsaci TaxID=166011 RepID=A0A915DFG0_9BILA
MVNCCGNANRLALCLTSTFTWATWECLKKELIEYAAAFIPLFVYNILVGLRSKRCAYFCLVDCPPTFSLVHSLQEGMRRKLVSAIDGIRNLHLRGGDDDEMVELEVDEKVAAQHCSLARIVRHGFPDEPRCLAYDPVQRLLAIGACRGCVRLLGQAGVDFHLKHPDSEEPVLFVQFLVNEGGLITALRDDSIHLWNYRQKTPEIVHSLKMAKEKVTCIHLPFQSKWLHVGTDKGNVYFICLANFELSTYVINWNKAIDVSCRTHPGAVQDLSLCPSEPYKLLMVYEKGHVVLWNLSNREVERFGVDHSPAKCVSWHYDGRQFMCGHKDGSLTIWNIKKPKELVHKTTPHSPNDTNACRPITHLSWSVNADTNEQLIVFAGGMPTEEGVLPALTVVRAKGSITVLEMDHPIVEMCALYSLPFNTLAQLPYGIAVLLKEDLLVIDMSMPGYPCFESPYPMDIHESPVTFLSYCADCPVDLIAALTLVGRNQRRQGVRLSDKAWPLTGGVDRECASGHQEMLLTGHEDGSIKFWQASSENLQVMYKLKTGRHFEKSSSAPTCSASSEDPAARTSISHAVTGMELCLDSRLLLVSGASGQVTLFRFVKTESSQDIAVVVLPKEPFQYQQHLKPQRGASSAGSSPSPRELRRQHDTVTSSRDSHSTDTSFGSQAADQMPLKVRGGALRRPAGYQPELVCQIPWIGGHTPERITAISLNSAYGVLAIGTSTGVALVDILASTQIYSWSNAELHGREGVAFSAINPSANNDISSPSEPSSPHAFPIAPSLPCSPSPTRRLSGLFRRQSNPPAMLQLVSNESPPATKSRRASTIMIGALQRPSCVVFPKVPHREPTSVEAEPCVAISPVHQQVLTEEDEGQEDEELTVEQWPASSPNLLQPPGIRSSSSYNCIPQDVGEIVQSNSSTDLTAGPEQPQTDYSTRRRPCSEVSNTLQDQKRKLRVAGRSNSLKLAATMVKKWGGKVRLARSLSTKQHTEKNNCEGLEQLTCHLSGLEYSKHDT